MAESGNDSNTNRNGLVSQTVSVSAREGFGLHRPALTFIVDGNHPFAGRDLTYRLRIRVLRAAIPEEISSHAPQSPLSH